MDVLRFKGWPITIRIQFECDLIKAPCTPLVIIWEKAIAISRWDPLVVLFNDDLGPLFTQVFFCSEFYMTSSVIAYGTECLATV